jgi:hypothetical protein
LNATNGESGAQRPGNGISRTRRQCLFNIHLQSPQISPPRVLRSHVQIVQSTLQRVAAVETEYDFLEFLPETLFHTFPIVTPELFCKPEHDRNRAESVRQNALKPLRHKDPPSRNKTSDNQQFSERTGTITHTNRMPDTTIWAFGGLIDQSFSSAARGTQSKSMKILWAGYLRRN